jgi:hypothetical protein
VDDPAPPLEIDDFRESVLSDLREDWVGVHEVLWEANTRYPELPMSQRLGIAERLVSGLIRDGLARLAVGQSSQPQVKRPGEHPRMAYSVVPIPDDEVAAKLRESETWNPEGDELIVLARTE